MGVYLNAFLRGLEPDPKVTINEWADRYRVLPSESSSEPGRYKTDRMPYLKEIAYELSPQSTTQRVSVVKGTQIGFTELGNNMLFTYADLYPCPMLLILPTETLAKNHASNKIWKSIEQTPRLAKKIYPRKKDNGSSLLSVNFPGGNITIGYSQTTATFASVSRRVVIKDDLDRWLDDVGGEGNPSRLADKRADAYPNKKIYANSSPTLKETSKIWKEFKSGSQGLYYMPCPNCKELVTFTKDGFKYSKNEKGEIVGDVVFVCKHCNCEIKERQKFKMMREGKYIHKHPNRKHKSYRVPSYYSPFLGWREIFEEYEAALREYEDKGNSKDLIVWYNTRDANVYEEKTELKESKDIELIKGEFEPWQIPEKTAFLTMAVDVQLDHFWIDVWVHRYGANSISIRHERVETWPDVEDAMRYAYKDKEDRSYFVRVCGVDSGYNANDVYEFCAANMDVAIPIKGKATQMKNPWQITTLDNGLKLYILDVNYFKDMFWAKILRTIKVAKGEIKIDTGLHFTHKEAKEFYFKQITSEQKRLSKIKEVLKSSSG